MHSANFIPRRSKRGPKTRSLPKEAPSIELSFGSVDRALRSRLRPLSSESAFLSMAPTPKPGFASRRLRCCRRGPYDLTEIGAVVMQAPKGARLSGLAPGGKRLHGVVEGQRQETHHAVGHVELHPDQLGQRQRERQGHRLGPRGRNRQQRRRERDGPSTAASAMSTSITTRAQPNPTYTRANSTTSNTRRTTPATLKPETRNAPSSNATMSTPRIKTCSRPFSIVLAMRPPPFVRMPSRPDGAPSSRAVVSGPAPRQAGAPAWRRWRAF